MALFWLLQQVCFIYILTLVFFTLPCYTEPQVFKVNQSGWLYMPGCICNLMELSIYHMTMLGKAGAQPLSITQNSELIMCLDRQCSPLICCQILQQWSGVRVELM